MGVDKKKTESERLNDLYPVFYNGQHVVLDGDMDNSCTVTVVRQTQSRMFTTVTRNGNDTWDVMTRRLTPIHITHNRKRVKQVIKFGKNTERVRK